MTYSFKLYYDGIMTSQIIFKVEKKIKDKAMKKAQNDGIAFAAVLKLATQAYIEGDLDIKLIAAPQLNAKTRKELAKISKDIKASKNLSPKFTNAHAAIAYLKLR